MNNITTSRRSNKLHFKKWAESTPNKFRFAIKILYTRHNKIG
jgi:uncharacterized protein YecE (DUF72 family)